MDSAKVVEFLKKQKTQLIHLGNMHHKDGQETVNSIENQIKMAVRRIYPNFQEVEKRLFPHRVFAVTTNTDDHYWQKMYLDKIKIISRAIDTILAESQLFGLEDFTPEKEKVESEVEVSTRKIGWRRTKKK